MHNRDVQIYTSTVNYLSKLKTLKCLRFAFISARLGTFWKMCKLQQDGMFQFACTVYVEVT